MGAHQAPGDDAPSPQVANLRQEQDKPAAVVIVEEDERATDAAARDVKKAVGQASARSAWHVPRPYWRRMACDEIVTPSLQGLSLGRGSDGLVG
jgi:hypothetical protein